MEQAYSRWLTHVTEPELLEQLKNMSEQERQEAFCRELAFGTGGLRGILGAGTNRIWNSMKTIRSGQNEPMPRCGQPVRSFCNSKIWPAALAAGQSAYSVQ